jgi:hypothetical protein
MKTRLRRDPHYAHRSCCPEWESFERFYKDMGECPNGFSLERIDNEKGYFPDNCIWIPIADQAKNTSRAKSFEWRNVKQNMSEWIYKLGLNRNTVWARIYRGWPTAQALGLEPRTPHGSNHR